MTEVRHTPAEPLPFRYRSMRSNAHAQEGKEGRLRTLRRDCRHHQWRGLSTVVSSGFFVPFHTIIWRMADLSRKRVRSTLASRRDPYWQRLAAGAYLGFRRGPDTWHARFRGRDKKQQYQPLGEALEYDEAKRRAEEWLAQLTGSPVRAIKRGTVLAALYSYLNDLRRHDRADAATKAEGQFKTALRFDPHFRAVH